MPRILDTFVLSVAAKDHINEKYLQHNNIEIFSR